MYFNYPLDTKYLLRKKRQIKKKLLASEITFVEKKVAILGGSTTNEIADQLEIFLLRYGIKAQIYQSEYGKYFEDSVFGNKILDEFQPDIVYIHTNWRNITEFPSISTYSEDVENILKSQFNRFTVVWDAVRKRYRCPIIQNNFDRPSYRLLGNKDVADIHGRTNFISRMNQLLYRYAQEHQDFFINDLDYLASDYGLSAWSDSVYWHMYKYAMSLEAVPYIADSVAKIIKSIYGKNKKVLVLDLDNTLWGGVVGDDGVKGLAIGPEIPSGQVYSEFQNYCKELKSIGVILGIISKNDENNAIDGLNHPDGTLRPDDFVSIKANWESKDKNLLEMVSELALSADSFVFFDDNPAEREIVSKQIPCVAVPEVGKVENFIKVLEHSGFFEVVNLSDEDIKKTEMYHAKAEATKAILTFSDYGEYLDSLKMKATIKPFEDMYVQRIAQLTNKSNQFNLTTLRCSEEDIRKMMDSERYITLYGKLVDKFGDNGVVNVVAGEIKGKELHIRLWLMSCRVLKRGMEDAMMDELMQIARKRGIEKVYGYYYPTVKNGMVKDFYTDMGFVNCTDNEESGIFYIKTELYSCRNKHIIVR